MSTIETKLQRRLFEIRHRAWYVKTIPLTEWHRKEGGIAVHDPAALGDGGWEPFTLPAYWGGYDVYTWFQRRIKAPEDWRGQPVTLVLDLVETNGEALVFLDGLPAQGIDRNRHEILLTSKARHGDNWQIHIEAYSGRDERPKYFPSAFLAIPNLVARDLYFSLKNIFDAALILPADSTGRLRLLAFLEGIEQQLDFRAPGSEDFQKSIEKTNAELSQELKKFSAKFSSLFNRRSFGTGQPGRLWICGHAHIDICWLWTLDEVKRKCGRTFATALRLMEQYPEYHFVQSQPQLYAFVKENYPTLYSRIKKQVKAERWEPVGAMWVEADCNIPSGEALVRQVMYGKQFFKQEFGVEIKHLWLPDVFGYSAALPQILKKAGVDYFFTTKIAWNERNRFPYSTFWWQGIDGTRIFAHLTFLHNLYNSELTAADLKEAWDTFKQKRVSNNLLLSYGWGDGGGGPTAEHLENARRLEKFSALPECEGKLPALHRGSVHDFFMQAEREAGELPVWNGELYLEAHRGTLTTQARIKRANRKCELLLRDAEILTALASLSGFHPPREQMAASWKKVLLNQFHDILPGSSIPQVYEQAQRDYAEVQQACESMITQAMQHLAAQGVADENSPTLVVFNTLSWPRRAPVEVQIPSLPKSFTVVDAQGKLVDTQILSHVNESIQFLFDANVPAMGYSIFYIRPAAAEKSKHQSGPLAKARGTILENGYFRARFDNRGRLASLWDRRTQREVIAKGQDGNLLQTFEDAPAAWEAWDINADFENKPLDLFHCQSVEVGESGPLRASLRIVFASAHSRIEQEVFIYRDFPRLDFVTHIDWHEQRTLLKVAFPVDVLSSFATYEIQYGSVQRPAHRNTSWDAAKFEVAAQKWADLSEANYGVSLLNDCKYGYDIFENQLRLTLLRSPYMPHPFEPHLKVDWENVADQGRHELIYSLYPHPGDWRSGGTVEAAYELNVPLRILLFSPRQSGNGGQFELMRVRATNVVMEACKPAEEGNGIILRLYEAHGGRGPADLIFFEAPRRVELVNLLEETVATVPHEENTVPLYFTPFEIKTLRVIW